MANPTALKCVISGCPHERQGESNYCLWHETPADRERKAARTSKNDLSDIATRLRLQMDWWKNSTGPSPFLWDDLCRDALIELEKRHHETSEEPAGPKVGDPVTLHMNLPGAPLDGWRISLLPQMGTLYMVEHPSGGQLCLLRDQFSVKSNEQPSAPVAVVLPALSEAASSPASAAAGVDPYHVSTTIERPPQ